MTRLLFCPICALASSKAVEVEGMSRRAERFGVTPSTVAERAAWQALQPGIDIDRLVLIEETGASTKMARLNGHSPRCTRCVASMRRATGKRRRSSARSGRPAEIRIAIEAAGEAPDPTLA
jgi:hypothetical protein